MASGAHDHHEPADEHDPTHPGWTRRFLAGFRHGPSHGPGIDPVPESSTEGIRALRVSLGVLAATALAQGAVVVLSRPGAARRFATQRRRRTHGRPFMDRVLARAATPQQTLQLRLRPR